MEQENNQKTENQSVDYQNTQQSETKSKNKKRTNWWAIVLLILLLGALGYFAWDKYQSLKEIKAIKNQKDSLAYVNTSLASSNESLQEQFDDSNKAYESLLKKYNSLLDSALLTNSELDAKQKELLELQKVLRKQDSIVKSINRLVKDALLGFKEDELTIEVKNGRVYVTMQDKLLFESGSAEVEPKGIDALGKLSKVLNKNKDINVMIEGHTDNVPINTKQYPSNWELSVARATSIIHILTKKHKVSPLRITAAGRSEYYPIATNKTEEGKAKNRRTEIILSPDLEELYKLATENKVSK